MRVVAETKTAIIISSLPYFDTNTFACVCVMTLLNLHALSKALRCQTVNQSSVKDHREIEIEKFIITGSGKLAWGYMGRSRQVQTEKETGLGANVFIRSTGRVFWGSWAKLD